MEGLKGAGDGAQVACIALPYKTDADGSLPITTRAVQDAGAGPQRQGHCLFPVHILPGPLLLQVEIGCFGTGLEGCRLCAKTLVDALKAL